MNRPGFTFCICPDLSLIQDYIQRQLDNFPHKKWNKKIFWGDEPLSDNFWSALSQPDLFGTGQVIILRRCEQLPADFWSDLSRYLKGFKACIWPFFCLEKNWERGKPKIPKVIEKQKYWDIAKKKGWIWQNPGLTRASLPDYITKWAKRHGKKITPQVLNVMVSLAPEDSTTLNNELKKLELYVGQREHIELVDLAVLNSYADIDIFAFFKGVQTKGQDIKLWSKVLREQQSGGDFFFPFLGLLVREARILWQLVTGDEKHVSLYPKLKSQKKSMAQKLGLKKLSLIFDLALEAEVNVKTGQYTAEQALEILTAKLIDYFHN
ncbi:hypothetical protein KFV02_01910 [Desulfohalobiaceae bacterium Ax17]|uniref:DNA polymerase III subunit delta n=1 Tax=Desulfovulcanus ferrireducens TaxID=2831190 RepID=UPI00207BB8D7|nr:DNA polymerase III subunit delta [Desulfovulcanus ferrireducens]MBT8762684.1 hypothetical protein [Desulfovulcanus ferrireducens]